jgi:6-phosphogluconolactonase
MIRVFNEFEALSQAAAQLFVSKAKEAIAARGRFGIALAGGNTPRRMYDLLRQPPLRDEVDWSKVHVFFGDERFVPPTDVRSNERMAREALLNHVPVPPSQIHPIYRQGDIETVAQEYSQELEEFCHGQRPTLDFIILGMGPDGHTASLFPGGNLDTQTQRIAIPVLSSLEVRHRITLTVPVLGAARTLLFIVVGIEKAGTLARVLMSDPDQIPLPAGVVAKHALQPVWFVDGLAATMLPPEVMADAGHGVS